MSFSILYEKSSSSDEKCQVKLAYDEPSLKPHSSSMLMKELYQNRPVILAPLEDVSDDVFRSLCRSLGADICVTEFVNVEGLLRGCRKAKRKITLSKDDTRTAIQIYGSSPERLAEAAAVAESRSPLFIDINCGCWVPKIAGRGAGAGWLRNPQAMVDMAKMVVSSVSLPVTIKTRIGYGPESDMPIVDLARRLEDVGISAITIHCRTANMGHSGKADWTWAEKTKKVVSIPVIVNGDIRSAHDAKNAIESTGCEGVMIGRRAIEHPWIFRECRELLDHGGEREPPSAKERIDLCKAHLRANVETRGEPYGVRVTRRHLPGYLHGLFEASLLRQKLNSCDSYAECIEILDSALDKIHLRHVFETQLPTR